MAEYRIDYTQDGKVVKLEGISTLDLMKKLPDEKQKEYALSNIPTSFSPMEFAVAMAHKFSWDIEGIAIIPDKEDCGCIRCVCTGPGATAA
jgi:hypothetical protein